MTAPHPVRTAAVALVAIGAFAACGGEEADERPVAGTPTAAAEPSEPAETAEPADLGDAALLTMTAEEVCAALTVDEASLAIGTEVALAEVGTAETPQCTYTYGGDSASLSTFTVAVQRPEDVDGRGLQDAFDHVLDVNVDLGGDGTVERADVEAGERGVRLGGATLALTVVASAGHLLTVLTTPDLDATDVEALAAAAADAVA
ncbi:MAG: hypothetical protein JWN84_2543 [Nocardioides sp.]|nr:hypothetical protein [Nocardioides sp.]